MERKDITDENYDYLQTVYAVFMRTKAGKELLKSWEKFYIYRQSIIGGQPEESAKRDGEKRFILKVLVDIETFKKLNKEKNDRRSSSTSTSTD